MIFSKLQRTLSDRVLTEVSNIEGATITTGYPVAYHVTNSADGVNAFIPKTTAHFAGFAGIALKDIAINDYGLIVQQGFVNSIFISNVGSSITVNAGDPLVPGALGFASSAPTYANSGFRWAFASNVPVAISASGYMSGLLRPF